MGVHTKRMLAVIVSIVVAVAATDAQGWDEELESFLKQELSDSELDALKDFFGDDKPLPGPVRPSDELGPMTFEQYRGLSFVTGRAYARESVRVTPENVQAEIEGSGTQEDPYRGLIAAALEEHEDITVLTVPAGHYEEAELEPQWLVGEDGAVLVPPRDVSDVSHLIALGERNGGVIDLELDGSRAEYDPEAGERALDGILLTSNPRHASVVGNHIRDMPGHGIYGRGAGSNTVIDNVIERVHSSGIRAASGWVVLNNRVRHAGLLRGGAGALGDDGIIISGGSVKTRVSHNLVIAQRNPNARHGIATHNAHENVIEHNAVIAIGELRGGIRFSDRSDHNIVRRNLVVGVEDDTGRVNTAIRLNGTHNEVYGNAIYCADRGINNVGWPATTHNVTYNNRAATVGDAYNFGLYDEQWDNEELALDAVQR